MPLQDADGREAGDDLDALANGLKALANAKRLHLLRFLARPHYLEEIASELGVARQTAQEHVQQLVELGLLQSVRGRGDHGPVNDYVVVPQRMFALLERLERVAGVTLDLDEEEGVDFRMPTAMAATAPETPKEHDLPRLVLVRGMRLGQTTPLTGNGPWLLGRDPHAAVGLDYDPYVSTRHAEVRRTPGGGWEVVDLYSSNGTFVDWKQVPRGTTAKLENGAVLRVGKSLLVFRRP